MGSESTIEWTNDTFNGWIGCTKVSEGCKNCYAESQNRFRRWNGGQWGPGAPRKVASPTYWRQPLRWNKEAEAAGVRRRVFCASLADVFDAEAPDGALPWLWALIESTPNLDWLLLTKRPERIKQSLPPNWGEGWPNVWLGTSVENQAAADTRIPHLRATPARLRFLSCEPLLGPVTLPLDGIRWVIVGGEGNGGRSMDIAWARSIRDQCASAETRFFMKQLGRNPSGLVKLGPRGDNGGDPDAWPEDLRVRSVP